MSYQLTGKIKFIGEIKQVSDTFKVREFVVTVDSESQYPQHIKLQVTNDRCDFLSTYTIGNDVTVHFNLRGRETEKDGRTNYWNTLDAWRVEAATNQGTSAEGDSQANTVPQNQQPVTFNTDDQEDGLPF